MKFVKSANLRVLAYHRVVAPGSIPAPNPSLVSATPAGFEQQMRHLAKRYRVVSLEQVLDAQRGTGALPKQAVLLTFDDGYRDFGEVVWPILRRYRLPATVFIPTAYPGQPERRFWWDRVHIALAGTTREEVSFPGLGVLRVDTLEARRLTRRAIQQRVKMIPHDRAMALVDELCAELNVQDIGESSVLNWNELRELAREGVSLAAHTQHHPAVTQLDAHDVAMEIRRSMADLTREIGAVLPVFCYPFGLHDDMAVEVARKEAIELAFTSLDGHNRLPSPEPLRLRRTVITSRTTPVIFALRLLKLGSYIDMWRHRRVRADVRVEQPDLIAR